MDSTGNPAIDRLRDLYAKWGDALDPNYSGSTGVSDLSGYAQQQNDIVEAENLRRRLAGQNPLTTRVVRSIPASPLPNTMFSPGQTSAVTGGSYDQILRGLKGMG